MLKIFSALLVGLTMVALPAHAQDTQRSNTKAQTEQNASDTGMWQASKLVGVNVYNGQNDKIGDIKELMIDKDGKVANVVIGVGGFLGMGERDVAVKFSELKWSDQSVRAASTSSSESTQTTGAAGSNTSNADRKRNYPDHALLNATKDQLKAMPQFNYSK